MNNREIEITKQIKAKILLKNPLAEVILYGSHARGQAHKDSDWDILILLNQPNVSRSLESEYRGELFEIELEIGEPISTFVFAKTEWEQRHNITPLYHNIKKEGVYL